jgi:hypothetical protein
MLARLSWFSLMTISCAFGCGEGESKTPPSGAASEGGEAGAGRDAGGEAGDAHGGAGEGGAGGEAGVTPAGGEGGQEPDPCSLPWSAPLQESSCDLTALDEGSTLSGYIDADETLERGKVYHLDGRVRVTAGVTLTIEPCVKIIGNDATSSLVILPDARIEAEGEPDAPIVFTSAKEEGGRAAGDWEGLLVLGNARTNAGEQSTLVGYSASFGSGDDSQSNESSGTLAYVRLEFTGRVLDPDANTRAGFTFAGVGSGTALHHLAVIHSVGDCFQWLGGSANASHLVGVGCQDDIFDAQEGFSGRVQFAFGRQYDGGITTTLQDTTTFAEAKQRAISPSSNGLELSSVDPYYDQAGAAEPQTTARWSNVTVCGQRQYDLVLPLPDTPRPQNTRKGLALRGNTAGSVANTLVTGFQEGFALASFQDLPDDEAPSVVSTLLGDNRVPTELEGGDVAPLSWFTEQAGNAISGTDGVCDCWSNPPLPFPPTTLAGEAPSGFTDENADFVGAFADARAQSNWMAGAWVGSFPEN